MYSSSGLSIDVFPNKTNINNSIERRISTYSKLAMHSFSDFKYSDTLLCSQTRHCKVLIFGNWCSTVNWHSVLLKYYDKSFLEQLRQIDFTDLPKTIMRAELCFKGVHLERIGRRFRHEAFSPLW